MNTLKKLKTLKKHARFGHLVVLGAAAPRTVLRAGKECRWSCSRCRCDCGREVIVPNWRLRTSHVKSCGCKKYQGLRSVPRRKRLPEGATFGSLTVVRPLQDRVDHRGIHHTQSEFRCSCGVLLVRDNSSVRRDRKRASCGHDRPPRATPESFRVYLPLVGSVFGDLTVLSARIIRGRRPTAWCRVRCTCGHEFDLWAEHLRHDRILQCPACKAKKNATAHV